MKFKLSTLFWIFTTVCLAVLLLVTNNRYEEILKEHNARKELIEKEYLRVTGETIPADILEEAMEQTDRMSVGVAQRMADYEIYKAKIGLLKNPSVLIQIRSGAIGGNPASVDMVGSCDYVRKIEAEEFEFNPEVDSHEEPTGFFRGGFIPDDKVFVIRKIAYKCVAHGDTNGGGEFGIELFGKEIVFIEDNPKVTNKVWLGNLVVRPGEESNVSMWVSNSSAGEALITGDFEPLENYPSKR